MASEALGALDRRLDPHLFLVAAEDTDPEQGYSDEPGDPEPGQLTAPLIATELGDSASMRSALDCEKWPETDPVRLQRAGPVGSGAAYLSQLRALFAEQVQSLPGESRVVWVTQVPGWLRVDGKPYWIFPILAISSSKLAHHSRAREEEASRWRSLVDEVVRETLVAAAQSFDIEPSPDTSAMRISADEVVRRAAVDFVRDMLSASPFRGFDNPYRDLSVIASLAYEGGSAHGACIRTRRDRINIEDTLVVFRDHIPLRDHERVRKILELTSRDRPAVLGPHGVQGVGLKNLSENPLEIRFRRKATWELWNGGVHLLSVRQGQATLPPSSVERQQRVQNFLEEHPNFPAGLLDEVVASAERISDRGHGALVVFSSDAEARSRHFASQGTPVEPIPLTGDDLVEFSAIDGAILVDDQGQVHAVGVILDGIVGAPGGDPGRGSRFNSAFNYVRTRTTTPGAPPTSAIVVSSDGSTDWISAKFIEGVRVRRAKEDATARKLKRKPPWGTAPVGP